MQELVRTVRFVAVVDPRIVPGRGGTGRHAAGKCGEYMIAPDCERTFEDCAHAVQRDEAREVDRRTWPEHDDASRDAVATGEAREPERRRRRLEHDPRAVRDDELGRGTRTFREDHRPADSHDARDGRRPRKRLDAGPGEDKFANRAIDVFKVLRNHDVLVAIDDQPVRAALGGGEIADEAPRNRSGGDDPRTVAGQSRRAVRRKTHKFSHRQRPAFRHECGIVGLPATNSQRLAGPIRVLQPECP